VAGDVVAAADEDEVVEVGAAVVRPGVEVVDVAPFGWCVAAGVDTAAVAEAHGAALSARGEAAAAPDVEDLAAVAHDPPHEGVAGEALHGAGRDGALSRARDGAARPVEQVLDHPPDIDEGGRGRKINPMIFVVRLERDVAGQARFEADEE
jgi:hypothetical protein